MNPLVLSQLNRLRNNVRALHEKQQTLAVTLAEQAAENDRLTKSLFRHEREKNTLQMNERSFDDLKARYERMAAAHAEISEKAVSLAAMAAALVESMEP